jgi:glycosyltransferase involved in cell wall biosynthesis
MSPLQISVILAVKNEERYILECLNSILHQSNVSFEVIVVDDNSADATYEIIKKNPISKFLKLYKSPGFGKVAAFNFGVKKAKGQFLCLFAGDDLMPKDSLYQRLLPLNKEKNNKLICSLSKIKIISSYKLVDGLVLPRGNKGSFSGQSPLISSSLARKIFPIPDSLINEDTWIEIFITHMKNIKIIHLPAICCFWRMHEGNSTNIFFPHMKYKNKFIKRHRAYVLFLNKFKKELDFKQTELIKSVIFANYCYKKSKIGNLIFSKAPLTIKLRLLASINPYFFFVRKTFLRFLSGW